jgi:hypothetical protein
MNSRTVSPRARWWKYPVGLIAVLAPFTFIWRVDQAPAGFEYELNTWFVGYNGEHFRAHGSFPETFQTSDRVGTTVPVFYGYLLFKVGGLLSLIGGAHLAVRLILGLCFASVYFTVRHALRRFRATEALAALAACAVCWATYPLTNLYNRFAFAEFVASSCLTCSCCLWAVFFLRPRAATGWPTALTAGFFLTLAAGSHPITGMLGLPFLVLVYLLQWTVPVVHRPDVRRRHAALAVSAGLALVVLGPWLFAYLKVGKELAISESFIPGLGYFEGKDLTAALLRVAPVPMDYRDYNPEAPRLGVGHLDTQINVPLLLTGALVLLGGVWRALTWVQRVGLAWVLAPLAALGLAAFVVSVYRTGFDNSDPLFPKSLRFLWKVQFAYRLVAPINLAVLLVLVAGLAYRRAVVASAPRIGLAPVAVAIIGTFCATGFVVKLVHGRDSVSTHWRPARNSDPQYERWLLSHICPPARDYVTGLAPRLSDAESLDLAREPFSIGTGSEFGRVLPLRVDAPRAGFVGTQAVPFKWHTFRVDGEPVPQAQLRIWLDLSGRQTGYEALRVAVPVGPGEHTIEYAFTPPLVWSVLNALSPWVLTGWFAVLVARPIGCRVARWAGRGRPREADEKPVGAAEQTSCPDKPDCQMSVSASGEL